MNEYLTVDEAAGFLRVKRTTIYAWVHQRKLPYRKHGRRLAFERKDLERWSEAQLTVPVQESGGALALYGGKVSGPPGEAVNSSLKTRRTADESSTRIP